MPLSIITTAPLPTGIAPQSLSATKMGCYERVHASPVSTKLHNEASATGRRGPSYLIVWSGRLRPSTETLISIITTPGAPIG